MGRSSHGRLTLFLGLSLAVAVARAADPKYEAFVSEFYAGLAGLQLDDYAQAEEHLKKATATMPEEPVAWADLGLMHLRQGDFDAAATELETAGKLAPESDGIEMLRGLLEARRGSFDLAVGHYQKAIALSPKNLKARYALVKAKNRQALPGADGEILKLIAEILQVDPDNLVVLVEQARLLCKTQDGPGFERARAHLETLSSGWPAEIRDALKALKGAPAAGPTAARVVALQHTLIPLPEYQRALAAIEIPAQVAGMPLTTFLRLPAPPPAVAPAVKTLAFTPGKPGTSCSAVVLLWSDEKGPPRLLSADAKAVTGTTVAFPGGGKAPGPNGLLAADLDGDFLSDLVLAGAGGLTVALQLKDGSFRSTTEKGDFAGVWAADIDLDGDLDLVAAPPAGAVQLYQNAGDGHLSLAPVQPFSAVTGAREFLWADLDGDGTSDGIFRTAAGKVQVLWNRRGGCFEAASGPDAVALAVGDVGTGQLELIVYQADGSLLACAHPDVSKTRKLGQALPAGVRLLVADLDNNGATDLVATGREGTTLLLHDTAAWVPVAGPPGLAVLAVGDLDGDGRLDLVGTGKDGTLLTARNASTQSYKWQVLRPRSNPQSTGDARINSFGVGGVVDARTGLQVQRVPITGPVLHLGLGPRTKSDVIKIIWPNGTMQAEFDAVADGVVKVEQWLKGSCPFVFTDGGDGFRFVTDFLWRSPLGLRINAVDTAGTSQTEDWVRIRGNQLKARAGKYEVRITGELWESHYFDLVNLLVVDHPAGTVAVVDERFSPRRLPRLGVTLLEKPRPVSGVHDQTGRDVTSLVAADDRNYLAGFGPGRYQGVTTDHWVELPMPGPGTDWLVASGWIHPTDSSLNVAIAQSGGVRPQGLSLEVLQLDGKWRVIDSELGFPAGRNKTILIPVSGLSGKKLRLRTNLEIYWDSLAYAATSRERAQIVRVPARDAVLRYRGFSVMTRDGTNAPETPVYGKIAGRLPRWRDLEGFHTRFGDVTELVSKVDDRYVIMNAGDEMVLHFPAGPAPAGARDFVLVGDGWEKDGDFNTAFSRTVLPLPAHGRAYASPPGRLEQDPVYVEHRDDWTRYHTRYVTPRWFADELR